MDKLTRGIADAVRGRSWDGIAGAQLALIRADPDRSPAEALEEALRAGSDADREWFDRELVRAQRRIRS